MSKTIVYLFILALLGFSIYYFLVRTADGPYSVQEAGFTIKDTGSIGKIFMSANDGESLVVERTDSGWMVNKTYKVLPSALNLVMGTLHSQSALYPVTKNAYENAVKALATDGTKVEVYDRAGKKMRVFYVGGSAVNNSGTNMLMDGAKMPYVVQVPGFNGYLTPRYSTKIKDWRDRTIFNLPADEVKRVSLQYVDKPINSFVLTRENGGLGVKTDSSYMKYAGKLNARRAGVYVKYFSNINCEGYLNGVYKLDTIIGTSHKHSVLDVEGMHGQHQHMDIYWLDINKRSKNMTVTSPGIPDQYDADRLLAVINNGQDTVFIQHMVFRNIFRDGYEFFQEDQAVPAGNQQPGKQPTNVLMHKNQ